MNWDPLFVQFRNSFRAGTLIMHSEHALAVFLKEGVEGADGTAKRGNAVHVAVDNTDAAAAVMDTAVATTGKGDFSGVRMYQMPVPHLLLRLGVGRGQCLYTLTS